jgi:kinesin family protein 11
LHTNYRTLDKELTSTFNELLCHLTAQRSESNRLKRQLQSAAQTIAEQNEATAGRVQNVIQDERRQAAEDREQLMAQMASLVSVQAEAQESRLAEKAALIQKSISDSSRTLNSNIIQYSDGMDSWDSKEGQFLEEVKSSRDALSTKLTDNCNVSYIASFCQTA